MSDTQLPATDSQTPASGSAQQGPPQESPVQEPATTPDTAGNPEAAQSIDQLPDWAQKLIKDTRGEAASYRTKANSAEQASQATLDKIAQALGLKADDKPDPEALTKQLTTAQEQAKQHVIDLAVYRNAATAQANPDALLDSASFLAKVRALDPTAEDFTTQVNDAIKAAVTNNPNLKTARAAGSSGIEQTGGSGEQGQITEAQLARMTPEQIVEAQQKGLLKNLLG